MISILSKPSKMPGYSFGIPIADCKIGSILAKKEGSVCSKCYAGKGWYRAGFVKNAQSRRLQEIKRLDWVDTMVAAIGYAYRGKKGRDRVFRWHDSGDLQGIWHLDKIVQIAKQLPRIKFWLPTHELGMVKEFLRINPQGFPPNLIVRISAAMVGGKNGILPKGVLGSTVAAKIGYACPARNQGNVCGDCRACWDKRIKNIDYVLH